MTIHIIYGTDNGYYAFRDSPGLTVSQQAHQSIVPEFSSSSRENVIRCDVCGELLNKWESSLTGLKICKKQDVSATYDGVLVVSQNFVDVCQTNEFVGLLLRPLPDSPGYYFATGKREVAYDARKRGTRFVGQCDACGRYESVVGANPVYLAEGTEVQRNEFVRTDLEFGSGDEKRSLLLCGESVASVLNKERFKGLDLVEATH